MRLIEEHLGKALLVLAHLWMFSAWALWRVEPPKFPDESANALFEQVSRPDEKGAPAYLAQVQVAYSATPEARRQLEAICVNGPAEALRRPEDKFVWVPPQEKPKPFKAIELPPVTRAARVRPPQLLPSPGPSLQGAEKLPRWGEELPPLYVPAPPDPKKTGSSRGF